MTSAVSLPQPLQMVPDFALTTADGHQFRISTYRGRRNLVLIFAAGQWPDLITNLGPRLAELDDENTLVLVIAGQAPRSAQLGPADTSFPTLIDTGAQVSRRFGADDAPAVYITDQYGEIYSAHRAGEGTPLPDADEVLASLRHINAACPE